ncbi:WhiB family transcriptional regulator [Kribbella italica]|uniref:4Fe-4S Wbl-type domain-containing protein n=1 Tax=Kribbella italica TaxID=1540520 RepID=A0A7W9J287_9ACTN|nr:WhiB family transcriptional regulator [Kribbella italica]MBB5833548.1 hypothetical protein [Kribbella italica]
MTLTSIPTSRKAQVRPQVAGQMELPITPILPLPMRVFVNGWIRRDWRDRAACRDTAAPGFHSENSAEQVAAADQTCNTCPVRRSCLATALLHDEEGVWGATTEAERATITAKLAPLSVYWMTRSQSALPAVCRTDWTPGEPKTLMRRHWQDAA